MYDVPAIPNPNHNPHNPASEEFIYGDGVLWSAARRMYREFKNNLVPFDYVEGILTAYCWSASYAGPGRQAIDDLWYALGMQYERERQAQERGWARQAQEARARGWTLD